MVSEAHATTEPTADVEAIEVAAIISEDEAAPATLAIPDDATSEDADVHPEDGTAETEDGPDLATLLADLSPAQVRELNPRLADQIEHNGAQSREATLRRELGNDANQAARYKVYGDSLAEHGPNPAVFKAITEDRDLYARDNYNRTTGKSVLEYVNATPEQVERYLGKLDSLSGNDLTAVANELIVDMTAAIKADVSTSLTLADVPEDSPLRTEITAEAARLVAEELKAQGIEAKSKRDPAPNVPAGGVPAPGATNPLLEKLENQGRNALSADELKEVNRLLGY